MIHKEAFDFKTFYNAAKDVGDGLVKMLKGGTEFAWKTYLTGLAGATGLGLGAGYLAAKATAPTSIVDNSDKELELEALKTEIDVTERKLAAMELRRQRMMKNPAPQKYDRFV